MNKTEIHKISEFKSLDPEFPYMPKAEWESRISKARTMMNQKGIDALLILNMEDRLYFFGSQRTYKFVYPSVGIIPRNGPTTLITISDDRDVLHKQGYAERSIGYRGDIMAPTATSPDPIKLIAEVIDDLGLANKTIGMEFGPFMIWDAFTLNSWEQ
jgi:Xaa-Pro aminopeptidase